MSDKVKELRDAANDFRRGVSYGTKNGIPWVGIWQADLKALLNELESKREETEDGWVEIKEGCRMPSEGDSVWGYDTKDPGIFQARFTDGKFFAHRFGWGDYPATHWMPRFVPSPPQAPKAKP